LDDLPAGLLCLDNENHAIRSGSESNRIGRPNRGRGVENDEIELLTQVIYQICETERRCHGGRSNSIKRYRRQSYGLAFYKLKDGA
jgi:hypothetical protein